MAAFFGEASAVISTSYIFPAPARLSYPAHGVMFSLVHKKTTRGWFLIWNGRSENLKLHLAPGVFQADWGCYYLREPLGGLLKPAVPL
jgi:hypothetical protein